MCAKRQLPAQVASPDKFFMTDAGIMTVAIFEKGMELGRDLTFLEFMDDPLKVRFFEEYYVYMATIALRKGFGFLLECAATWKASRDRATNILGLTEDKWRDLVTKSNKMMGHIKNQLMVDFPNQDIQIGGLVGAREGGYKSTLELSVEDHRKYHDPQIKLFGEDPRIDYVLAGPLADVEEAKGIILAAFQHRTPLVISFTLRKRDCKLPSGQSLQSSIEELDAFCADWPPIYYAIECSHPSWFEHIFDLNQPWVSRIHHLRGNGSKKCHEELDESGELDSGDPVEYGQIMASIWSRKRSNQYCKVNVIGGCCGTDSRHLTAVAENIIKAQEQTS